MNAQVKHSRAATQKSAATNARNFRTFLLVSQFEAESIGARIAQARRESGLTQEQVSDVATFSKRSLQDYEAGVTIPWAHMREISALLGKPPEWFLHGDPEASPQQDVQAGLMRDVAAGVATLERSQEDVHSKLDEVLERLARLEGQQLPPAEIRPQ